MTASSKADSYMSGRVLNSDQLVQIRQHRERMSRPRQVSGLSHRGKTAMDAAPVLGGIELRAEILPANRLGST